MAHVSWFQKKCILIPFVIMGTVLFFLYKTCVSDLIRKGGNNQASTKVVLQDLATMVGGLHKDSHPDVISRTKKEITNLKNQLNKIERLYKIPGPELHSNEPIIYFVTPTYARYTQQADLVRLSNTLKHVPNLHWILVEDSSTSSSLVANLLNASSLTYTHLNIHTRKSLVRKKNDPRWKRHRGVDQRNHALKWIRTNVDPASSGVLYFGDDDNTYHLELFEEMRYTKKVSMWPVALVGGLRFEGPICSNGKVVKFFTAWMPTRLFPVDMAAFAVNIKLLFEHPTSLINAEVARGYLETDFLQQLDVSVKDVEAKANDCTRILVWHTQTAEPKMKEEIKLHQRGLESNPEIII